MISFDFMLCSHAAVTVSSKAIKPMCSNKVVLNPCNHTTNGNATHATATSLRYFLSSNQRTGNQFTPNGRNGRKD